MTDLKYMEQKAHNAERLKLNLMRILGMNKALSKYHLMKIHKGN